MPVGLPPRGGPLGRSRSRLSASSLTTFLRCQRQWLMGYQGGLQGPTRPSQLLGVLLEDAVCRLLMMHPPNVSSLESLETWAEQQIGPLVDDVLETGRSQWEDVLWKSDDDAWESVTSDTVRARLQGALSLFLHEVQDCYRQGGGPHLEARRRGDNPFSVREPSLSSTPQFPLPDKIPDVQMRRWQVEQRPTWQTVGCPIEWNEAWECARPWFKDPRVYQPQRLYHPEGWASGELDMVLRWDGRIRLVDIKSGSPSSVFAASLEHQLRFYAWLWHETHDGQTASGMEGWYLESAERVTFDAPSSHDIEGLSRRYMDVHRSMQAMAPDANVFPVSPTEACEGTAAGCGWCAVSSENDDVWHTPPQFSWLQSLAKLTPSAPYGPLGDLMGRVAVKGRLTGLWGPFPNHFGELVHGAMLVVGQQHIAVEESEPGAFPTLHDWAEQEISLQDALPGVWRDQARLYVDERSSIKPLSESSTDDVGHTRLGLLRTRGNVRGYVLSIQRRDGVRLDGKPWTMLSFMLWDGTHVAEVVAFGGSIQQRLLDLRPGDALGLIGAELGWRSGVLQLRIDSRKTRLEFA